MNIQAIVPLLLASAVAAMGAAEQPLGVVEAVDKSGVLARFDAGASSRL